MLRYSKWL